MTPLDDELRSLLHSRADEVAPAADPLSGIERRASRMRRNRVAASVAGSALVVAAIGLAVPSLVPDRDGASSVATTPSPEPSVEPSPSTAEAYGPNELDPAHPWAYRGDQSVLANGNLETLEREWTTKHPGSQLHALYGHVYEPSRQAEIAFVSHDVGDERWGVATASESGFDFLVDVALPPHSTVLMTPLPGDEVPRLLIVPPPTTGEISYAKDGTDFEPLTGAYPGVGFVPLEGDTSRDMVRVLDGDGDLDHPIFLGPAPDATATSGGPAATTPDNLVTWPSRGTTPDPAFWDKALSAFATGLGAKRDDVEGKVLFAGDDDARNVFVFGQAWIKGNDAHSFGYSVNSKGEATPFLGPVTEKGPAVLAFVVPAGAGQSRDLLVVIPEPAVKQTWYGEAQSEYIEITGQDYLDGVTLIDRFPDQQAGNDMLKLLDAAGRTLFEGKVGPLLCGVKECG